MRRILLGLGVLTLWAQPAAAQPAVCPSVEASLTGDAGDLGPTLDIRIRCPRRRAQLPPPPPPPPPPAPRMRVYVAAPPPPPPPPPVMVVQPAFRLGFTLGAFADSALFEDGALGGAGLHFRLRFSRYWALTADVSSMVSCTRCNQDADTSRVDVLTAVGLMYFPFPRAILAPYVRASFLVDAATFRNTWESEQVTLLGGEAGIGLEWRFLGDLALVADASVMYLGRASGEDEGAEPTIEGDWKGVPVVDENGAAAGRLRIGLVYKF